MIRPHEKIVAALGDMIAAEHRIEKLLERASRSPRDPRAVAWLWNQATECRDHARILARHRQKLDRRAPNVPYPRLGRRSGPTPAEALVEARDLSGTLARQYERNELTEQDPYLRKFLGILAAEHTERGHELFGIASGRSIFEDVATE